MSVAFFVTDPDGRIVRTGAVSVMSRVAAQASFDGETAHVGEADQRTQYWDGSALADRPTLPDPPALTAGVAADWTLPEGAEVTVDPLNGAAPIVETVTGTFSASLPGGAWRIAVNPPFPWRAAEWTIEVSA